MSIVLEGVSKTLGGQRVIDRLSLAVDEGELLVLLGASGSGKSTVLRLIAGLLLPDEGRILLHGEDVTARPPQVRGAGFVFQNYSLFRHMTVAENIEFGLRIRKVPAEERARRREALLDLVDMVGFDSRYAHQLSGGQRQRVALARALAHEPTVLLLDEPFGALDAKIRAQLGRNLREIQKRLGVTTILVTHDQEEAFQLGDRIGVIADGRLLEVERPAELYRRPRSLVAATFLGAGTVLGGRCEGGLACFGPLRVPLPPETAFADGDRVRLLFRPEQVQLAAEPPADRSTLLGRGRVVEQTFVGSHRRLRLRLPRLARTRQIAPRLPFGEEGLLVEAWLPPEAAAPPDEPWVSLSGWHILEATPPQLLVYDEPEAGATALQVAASLARGLAARTTLLEVIEAPEPPPEAADRLASRVAEAGLAGATVHLRQGQGSVAEQIVAESAEQGYDVLVLGRERSRRRRAPALGGTLMTVLEQCRVPILVAKAAPPAWRRVLICTAAGEPGKLDVLTGGRLARLLGAEVTLLYVTTRPGQPSPEAQAHLTQAAATLRAMDVASSVRIRPARSPGHGIVHEAGRGDYDLVVVGGHGPRSRSVLGLDDVTVRVVAASPVSVLVVPAVDGD
jgi:ABC-type Fe3+/spermidine/putrescine transport system ATPase subunit/nucleotide-binding universal stress UspA family protein